MSYDRRNGVGAYFIPNLPLASTTTAPVLLEMDIGAASADHGEMICVKACRLLRAGFICVGELAGGTSVAPQVLFKKRPTPLSATGETTAATVNVPDATAVGAAIYVEVDVAFAVGDSLEISHVIGTGTPTGKGFWFIEAADSPEVAGNNSELTASA